MSLRAPSFALSLAALVEWYFAHPELTRGEYPKGIYLVVYNPQPVSDLLQTLLGVTIEIPDNGVSVITIDPDARSVGFDPLHRKLSITFEALEKKGVVADVYVAGQLQGTTRKE